MDILNQIISKQNGAFFKIKKVSEVKKISSAGKKAGAMVTKETIMTVRKGINYRNIKSVIDRKIADGSAIRDPETGKYEILIEPLRWGEWDNQYKGIIINYKDKKYIRLYTSPNKPKVKYFLNGKEISKEDLIETGYIQNHYFNQSDITDVFTVNLDDIKKVY